MSQAIGLGQEEKEHSNNKNELSVSVYLPFGFLLFCTARFLACPAEGNNFF